MRSLMKAILVLVLTGCSSQKSMSTAEILEQDLALSKAVQVVVAGCVANGETDERVKAMLPAVTGQLCQDPVNRTLSKIDAGRGECLLTDEYCLFTVGYVRTARPLEQPTGTKEERVALVTKSEQVYLVYKASKSGK